MDRIVVDLLKDFEAGKISRRQLMQCMAMGAVATAASAMFITPAEAAMKKAFKAVAVNHISYNVSDYAKARDFYMDILGMKLTYDDGKGCALEFGSLKSPDSLYIRNTKPGEKANVDHLALSVLNWQPPAQSQALLTEFMKPLNHEAKYDGDAAWYGWDIDDYMVQVCDLKGVYPGAALHGFDAKPGLEGAKKINASHPKSTKGFKTTAINHISYNVADYAKSRDWYMDTYGMKLTYDDGKGCALEFGNPKAPDNLYIRNVKPGMKANVDHLAYSVANFNLAAAETQLKGLGLDPKFDGDAAWTIHDPDGYTIQVCGEKGVYPGAGAHGFDPKPGLDGAAKINAAHKK